MIRKLARIVAALAMLHAVGWAGDDAGSKHSTSTQRSPSSNKHPQAD